MQFEFSFLPLVKNNKISLFRYNNVGSWDEDWYFFLFLYFSCAFHAFILNNVMKQQHITIYKIVILFIQTSYFIAGESQEEKEKLNNVNGIKGGKDYMARSLVT